MNSQETHINNTLRQKFENFEPTPPEHIWVGIEKSLDAKRGFFVGNTKYYATAMLLIILLPIAYFGFYKNLTQSSSSTNKNTTIIKNQTFDENKKTESLENINEENENVVLFDKVVEANTIIETTATIERKPEIEVAITNSENDIKHQNQNVNSSSLLNLFGIKEGFNAKVEDNFIKSMSALSLYNVYSFTYGQPYNYAKTNNNEIVTNSDKKPGHWENTVFVSAEFSLSKLDSITILNSFSLGVEPSRYFNNNWFIRFGLDISSTGDCGFAKIDYLSNDFMGTYDDVYDITFDTIGGVVTPNYHTKTVEVWDTIQHIVVSKITNRYLFAQLPMLLGYKNKIGSLNWYAYAGPAIGFQIAKWIDEPNFDGKDIEIIDLDNKLPLRSAINYQLWVGAGIEYKLATNASIVIEPSFRHYFTSLYNDEKYKVNISGLALRLGFNYKIGK